MKNSQSKFANEKLKSSSDNKSTSNASSVTSSCCCGSKMNSKVEEVDVIEVEEN